MTIPHSLFAQKLRSYRASNGVHGRMTQEELAGVLDLSVDAISKYERSLSFMRGDLEHRLMEKLGWTLDEIVACREDWDARLKRLPNGYRVLREYEVASELGSVEAVDIAVQALERSGAHEFPVGFSAGDPIWVDILKDGSMSGVYVTKDGVLVAHIGLVFLNESLEAQFRARRLIESEFSLEELRRPVLPGEYFGYCAGVYIASGHQKAALPLLTGFVSILENLAEREVYLRNLAAIAASPIGHQLCRDLSFQFLGPHAQHADLEFWCLSGKTMSASLFARRSPKVQKVYSAHFGID